MSIDYRRIVGVSLNGVPLTSAESLAVVQQVEEVTPEMDLDTADAHRPIGSTLLRRKRKAKEIKIGVIIGNLYDLELRAQAADAIRAWAQDGILEVSYRPEQRLRVKAGRVAALGQVREWTQMIEISLVAYALPYWESKTAVSTTLNLATAGGTQSGTITPDGTADFAPCAVTITNVSNATIHTITVTVGDRSIVLENLELSAGAQLVLSHNDDMVYTITSGGVSKNDARTPDSDDELLVVPGQSNAISITADQAVSAVFSARGLWL